MRAFLYALILITIVAGGILTLAVYWSYYQIKPEYDARLSSGHIENEITITRDASGVPFIEATTESEAYYGLGYVHAQDRIWQLSINQLAVQGRFAEFFGTEAIDMDQFSLLVGFEELGRSRFEALSREEQLLLESYTNGINRFIDHGAARLPIEFSLTGVEPLQWEPHHVLAMMALRAWNHSTAEANLVSELLAGNVSGEIWQDLFPDAIRQPEEMVSSDQPEPLYKLIESSHSLQQMLGWDPVTTGSNAWVIPAEHTESGYPILAADPHTSLSIPTPWYEAVISISGESVSGFTQPGMPLFFIGRNEHISWAYTNPMVPDTDFFHPDNREEIAEPTTERRIIALPDGEERMIEYQRTSRGPVINHLFRTAETAPPLIMDWQGSHSGQDFTSWRLMNYATDRDEFESAASLLNTQPHHLFYADRQGETAHLTAGISGQFSDTGEQEQNPVMELVRPDYLSAGSSYLFNSNNHFTLNNGVQYGYFFEPDTRSERIQHLLETHEDLHTIESSADIQQDFYSRYAEEIVNILLPILEEHQSEPQVEQAYEYLTNWNFSYTTDETASTIFEQFLLSFGTDIYSQIMDEPILQAYYRHDHFFYKSVHHLLANGSVLFGENQQTHEPPPDTLVVEGIKTAIDELEQNIGTQTFEWAWENVHEIAFYPFIRSANSAKLTGNQALAMVEKNLLVRGPYTHGGHSTTINQGKYQLGEPFAMTQGPSLRFITDLGSSHYYSVLATGQSGNVLSSFYDDQIQQWRRGEYRTVTPALTAGESTEFLMKIIPYDR